MSGKFARVSKFRHVAPLEAKKEDVFAEAEALTTGDSNFVAANLKFFAFPTKGGGGPVIVHRQDQPGRLGMGNKHPTLNVHGCAVVDLEWSPFVQTILATAADDGTIKVSLIPEEGLTANITEAAGALNGHQKKVNLIHWHPTASNVLGSVSGDQSVKLWDVETQNAVLSLDTHPDSIHSFEFNSNGSQMATACKDKNIRVFDPRVSDAVVTFEGHTGGKQNKLFWAENRNYFGSAGFNKNNSREVKLWDTRKLDGGAVGTVDIDKQAGVFMAKYDPDTSILFLAGKGDGNIRYFELTDEAPLCHYLSEFSSNDPTKGIAFLPKVACDTSKFEIMKVLRLTGKNAIFPISFYVPRKANTFQADLYPDAYAGIASSNADAYFAGENKDAVLVSMAPGSAAAASAAAAAAPSVPKKSVAQLESELEAAHAKIKELEDKLAALQA